MKITITFKDPDVVDDAIRRAVRNEVMEISGLDEDEREDLIETRSDEQGDLVRKFVEYGEYVTIEFDTENGTATVLPQR